MTKSSSSFHKYILENNYHDAWKIIMMVFMLTIVAVLMWIFSSKVGTTDTSVPYYEPVRQTSSGLDRTREQMMRSSSGVMVDTSMTDAQRAAMMKRTATSVRLDTSLTDVERQAIMRGQ